MTLSGGGTWTSLSKHLKIVDFRHISSPTSKLQNQEILTFLPCISQMYLEILFESLGFVHSKNGCFMVSFIFSRREVFRFIKFIGKVQILTRIYKGLSPIRLVIHRQTQISNSE